MVDTERCFRCDSSSAREWFCTLVVFECAKCTRSVKTRYLVCQGCKDDHRCCFCSRPASPDNFASDIDDCESEADCEVSDGERRGVASTSCSGPSPWLASASSTCAYSMEGRPAGFAVRSSASDSVLSACPPSAPWAQSVFPRWSWPGESDGQEAVPPEYGMNSLPYVGAQHDVRCAAYYQNTAGYFISHLPRPVSISDKLAQRLMVFDDFLQNVSDRRRGRESRVLKIYERVPGATPSGIRQSDFPDLFHTVLQLAEELALEARLDKHTPSRGSVVVQKTLVLSQAHEKKQIIQRLLRSASRLIYHDSGCFVASQIMQEALISTPGPESVVEAAYNFMRKAHAGTSDRDYQDKLFYSMQHVHANHAFKMWVQLLAASTQLMETQELDTILDVVKDKTLDLVMNCQGVRSVNVLLEHFIRTDEGKVQSILDGLVEDDVKLDGLIRHEFANHSIQAIIECKPENIARVVCQNLSEYASHKYANYVLQQCIAKSACGHWVEKFTKAYIDHKDAIEGDAIAAVAIKRGLCNALKRQGAADMARKLEESCPEVPRQRVHEKGAHQWTSTGHGYPPRARGVSRGEWEVRGW